MTKPRTSKSKAVTLIAALFLFGALYKLLGFRNYEYYQFMFQYLPEKVILYRYVLSVLLRIAVIFAAFGLLFYKEFYRKLAIGLVVLNLVTLYWKHPYRVFFNIAVWTESGSPMPFPATTGHEALLYPYFPAISMIVFSLIDVVFSVFVLRVLTRPKIKSFFK